MAAEVVFKRPGYGSVGTKWLCPSNQMKSHPAAVGWKAKHKPNTFHIQLYLFEHACFVFSFSNVLLLGKFYMQWNTQIIPGHFCEF